MLIHLSMIAYSNTYNCRSKHFMFDTICQSVSQFRSHEVKSTLYIYSFKLFYISRQVTFVQLEIASVTVKDMKKGEYTKG